MKKLLILVILFIAIPNFAKQHDPQDIKEGTAGAGVLGGLLVGGITAAVARSPYGLLAAPAGAMLGVLIKRHRNKKRMRGQYRPTKKRSNGFRYSN